MHFFLQKNVTHLRIPRNSKIMQSVHTWLGKKARKKKKADNKKKKKKKKKKEKIHVWDSNSWP